MTPMEYFDMPTPPNLWLGYPLVIRAAVANLWPALSRALDVANTDTSCSVPGVYEAAGYMFVAETLPYSALRYCADVAWTGGVQ